MHARFDALVVMASLVEVVISYIPSIDSSKRLQHQQWVGQECGIRHGTCGFGCMCCYTSLELMGGYCLRRRPPISLSLSLIEGPLVGCDQPVATI